MIRMDYAGIKVDIMCFFNTLPLMWKADWKYEGTALYPDSPYDCHGVYSGSALAESEKLHLFFTGNVKIDGDYDYINEGRETSTLHVESEDGIHFGDKDNFF